MNEQLLKRIASVGGVLELGRQGHAHPFAIDEAVPFIISSLYKEDKRPFVYIASTIDRANNLRYLVSSLIGKDSVIFCPEPDQPFQQVIPDPLSLGQHVGALTRILTQERPFIILSSDFLCSMLPSAETIKERLFTISKGTRIKQSDLALKLEAMGFTPTYQAENPGQFARRGEVFDIYPVTFDMPIRIDFFDWEIEDIRYFDPSTQRSEHKRITSDVTIGPASSIASIFYSGKDLPVDIGPDTSSVLKRLYAPYFNTDDFFSYLPNDAVLICEDIREIEILNDTYYDQMKRMQETIKSEHDVEYPEPIYGFSEIKDRLISSCSIEFVNWKRSNDDGVVKLPFRPIDNKYFGINNWISTAKELLKKDKTLCVISHQASRLHELLEEDSVPSVILSSYSESVNHDSVSLINSGVEGGFCTDDLFILSDRELFGVSKLYQSSTKRRSVKKEKPFDAEPGDYVVHIEHGIARFAGTVMKPFEGAQKEYLKLQYADGDYLYVPMEQMDRVSRYIGSSNKEPVLHRLGGNDWNRTQKKAKAAAEEVAEELLNLYAEREIQTGFQFSKDTIWQMEMENAFPYTETQDQLQAIEDVKRDMASPRPMDRLICGDVGYGKTEVALRAAFKAVMDNKQVAVLVPTTVLAQQHYNTFSQRLAAFPVRVRLLSRFVSQKEIQNTVTEISEGDADIVIGTHRLLQPDIKFKSLGLLVIDEEQRFGVEHKEHIKQMKSDVDVLTLSATPIPRTLQLSLTGVRNMSLIETPPEERIPVHTVVSEFDETLIRDAVMRELARGGQVFFVHNRVSSINSMAKKIQRLIPDARVRIGHGQMSEDELEQVMMDFVKHEFDILVCTTIIESGVDIPNANTLIVNDADRFGLTQLYQLRGRVGRSSRLAYAYFLYEKSKLLRPDADKRLQTIFEASSLGVGMTLAMKDLEIRGAGNMLGTKQSGHIDSVGFNYYTQLLSEAVEELRRKRDVERHRDTYVPKIKLPPPSIDLPLVAFIPSDYIEDAEQRVGIYKRMATCTKLDEFFELASDISDRFGEPPIEVTNLLFVLEVKIRASLAMLSSVLREGPKVILRRIPGLTFDVDEGFGKLRGIRVTLNQVQITYSQESDLWKENLILVLKALGPADNH